MLSLYVLKTIDGVPLAHYDVDALRSRMAVVGQEPVLFAGTIAENVALGCPGHGPSFEEIREACQLANAADFIEHQLLVFICRICPMAYICPRELTQLIFVPRN